jgi:hypothetical protein
MKKYHIFETLFLSFYSKALYRNVAEVWRGFGLVYLLLVLAICWLPFSYDFQRFLTHLSSQILPKIVTQMPTMTFSKGKLSIDRPVPYMITMPGNGAHLAVIDTSGRLTSFRQVNSYALITQGELMIKDTSTGEIKSYPFTKIADSTITRHQFKEYLDKIVFMSSILMYPLSVLISVFYRFLQACVLGLIGLLIAYLFRVKITYKTSIRLAVVAFTPMLFIATLVEYFSWPIPFFKFIAALLVLGYLTFAIYSASDRD